VNGERQPDSPVEVVKETPKLDRLPVFVRAGAILPRQPLTQSTADTPVGPLELHVYPGPDCRGELYWDDGVSIKGPSLRQTIRCEQTGEGLRLSFERRTGSYKPWWRSIAVTVHDWSGDATIRSGSRRFAREVDATVRTLRFTIPDQPRAATIGISRL
jgi:alpha-glucosidase